MQLIDAHTHAHFAAFKEDWRETIQRALDKNIWVVNVGTQKDTSVRAIEVAHSFKEGVFATVGLHPIHTAKSFHDAQELGEGEAAQAFTSRGEGFDHDHYLKLAKDEKVVAIGECGLDYYRLEEDSKKRQAEAFLRQIELAQEVDKLLMIHCRQAFPDLLQILKENSAKLRPRDLGIIHFFSGTVEEAEELLALGFSFTFGGVITFTQDYNEVIGRIPLDRILSETDAPYVAPAPHRGKRNEPSYVVEVVKRLAELKSIPMEEMADAIWQNARRVFMI